YAFDYGPVHFLVLDDVIWTGATASRPGSYRGGLGRDQLEFIRQDLAHVPRNQLVVLLMHIPILEIEEREELFRLLEDRPHTLSISAHTHIQRHLFLGPEQGWRGRKPHHHFNSVTVCGSWWTGAPDERGIPHTTMRDGAPNGYSIVTFSGNRYTIEFCPARRPASHQMNIYAPESITSAESGQTPVLVNVFAGSERSKVEMRLGEKGNWIPMQRVDIEDPDYARLKEMERSDTPPPGRKLPEIIKSPHIWQATLPPNAPAGTHVIHVRTTDMFGKTYQDCRVIRIR
ncbi:MAG: calcineurin-like phosphoesterase C-terminal domain-containing protein, partial [Chloroherpetonaceae bacterium]|nr:calcineurin-like phosphoesterase C-terminal domain-containing protein [Chloroherpetonaceae bacterium]